MNMNSLREQAFIIKGYLMASEAPASLLAAIEIIIAELPNPQIIIVKTPLNELIESVISKRQPKNITSDRPEPKKIEHKPTSVISPSNEAEKNEVSKKEEKIDTTEEHVQEMNTSADVTDREESMNNVQDSAEKLPIGKKVYRIIPPFTVEKEHEAVRLYTVEKLSVQKIADKLESYGAKVNDVLKAYGVQMRPSAAALNKQKKIDKGIASGQAAKSPANLSPSVEDDNDDESSVGSSVRSSIEPSPAPRPKVDDNEYFGTRPSIIGLGKSDLGDVEKMLDNGLPKIRVAKSYGVKLDELDDFLDENNSKHKGVRGPSQGNG